MERGRIQQRGGTNTERHRPERANETENEIGDNVSGKDEQTEDERSADDEGEVDSKVVASEYESGMERMVDYPMSRLGIKLWDVLPQSARLDAPVASIWDTKKRIGEMIGGLTVLWRTEKSEKSPHSLSSFHCRR